MTNSIEHYKNTNTPTKHTPTQTTTGQASSMEGVTFQQKALTYETDIPTTFRPGTKNSTALALRDKKQATTGGALVLASDQPRIIDPLTEEALRKSTKHIIASRARQLDKPRKSGDRIVQRRIGWQATPHHIRITVAERELWKTPNGAYRPVGQWLIENRRTYPNAKGTATKRTGKITDTLTAGAPISETQKVNAQPNAAEKLEQKVASQYPEGAWALGMLPAQVREGIITRVPNPIEFDGTLLQRQSNPLTYEVHVLRMDNKRAVVVKATREEGSTTWEVSQAAYELGEVTIEQA